MHRTKGQLFILALVYVYTIAKHRVPCLMLNRTWDDWSEAVSGQQPPRSDVVLFAVCLTGSTRDYQIGFFYFPSSFFSSLFFFYKSLPVSLCLYLELVEVQQRRKKKKKSEKILFNWFFLDKKFATIVSVCFSVCKNFNEIFNFEKKNYLQSWRDCVYSVSFSLVACVCACLILSLLIETLSVCIF